MADLVVELYGAPVGTLAGTWRTFDFLPDPAAVNRFGIDSPVLSVAIPLAAVTVRSRKERRQNFFRELLPEGRMLTRLAQQAGLAEQDAIGLLRAYGRDVARALQIRDPDVPGEPKQPALEPLSTRGVATMLEHVQDNPLGNKPSGGKTSLAGVQDKIVLAVDGEYRHAAITISHLVTEGRAWGLAEAADLAGETLTSVLHLANTEAPSKRAHTDLARDISGFASNLLAGRAIGASRQHRDRLPACG